MVEKSGRTTVPTVHVEADNGTLRLRWSYQRKRRSLPSPRLKLVEFDLESAIASLKAGEPVIPVLLDIIHLRVAKILAD